MRASLASLLLSGCFYATAEKIVVIDDADGPVPGEEVGETTPTLEPEPPVVGACDREPLEAPTAMTQDDDGDGLSNATEEMLGTELDNPDTDADGLPDGLETVAGTEPRIADTDADALLDGAEIAACTDPLHPDTDLDGVLDGHEVLGGTNPRDEDSDEDNVKDGDEILAGTDPRVGDSDMDGLFDGDEPLHETDPLEPDTDADALLDGEEVALGTSPLIPDTDGDSLLDGFEVDLGTNPLLDDSDLDGIDDGGELNIKTDPTDDDTDDDSILDGEELFVGSNPLSPDSDEDGLADPEEIKQGLDPALSDSDGDGVEDGVELEQGSDPLDAESFEPAYEPGRADWTVRYREGVMCSTSGAGQVGLWPLALGGLAVLAGRRRKVILQGRTALPWLVALSLISGCYYERRTVRSGTDYLPEVVEAFGRCFRAKDGPIWSFGAKVVDADGPQDVVLVETHIFDDFKGKKKPEVGLELLPTEEEGFFYAETFTDSLDCRYEGYVAEFVAYDRLLSSEIFEVPVEPLQDE